MKQGKDRLALANISGAMMIQATVPTAFGLLFTPWLLGRELLIAAEVTVSAVPVRFAMFRSGTVGARALASVGLIYGAFVGLLVAAV